MKVVLREKQCGATPMGRSDRLAKIALEEFERVPPVRLGCQLVHHLNKFVDSQVGNLGRN